MHGSVPFQEEALFRTCEVGHGASLPAPPPQETKRQAELRDPVRRGTVRGKPPQDRSASKIHLTALLGLDYREQLNPRPGSPPWAPLGTILQAPGPGMTQLGKLICRPTTHPQGLLTWGPPGPPSPLPVAMAPHGRSQLTNGAQPAHPSPPSS